MAIMDVEAKVAHLLRRFGLGAGKYQMREYVPLGVDGTLQRLLDYETQPDVPASPWEFAFDKDGNLNLEAPRFINYWSYRFLVTRRPLQEKLALFWHDHFAVSAAKVEFGPLMLNYLQTIYANASGNFRTLLGAMVKDPAMMQFLDVNTSNKFSPNENLGREVMELYTMGGGYTEKDVKEAARAFTGWAFLPTFIDEKKGPAIDQIKKSAIEGGPLVLFIIVPYLHDDGEKTILGKSGKFDGDDVLDILVNRPETARYITTKLWEFFAYANPEKAVIDRLAKTFTEKKFEIRPVLKAIAESDEFWSSRCIRRKVKSPVDFNIPIVRQLDIRDILISFRKADARPDTPIADEIAGASGYITFTLNNQGMTLFYPPSVAGWDWEKSWATAAAQMDRVRTADLLMGNEKETRPLTDYFAKKILADFKPKSESEVVDALLKIFDAEIPREARQALIEECRRTGGPAALKEAKTAAHMLGNTAKLLFAVPEFHMC